MSLTPRASWQFGDGQVIVQQGQVGNGLYIVVSGDVRIVAAGDELARLDPGDFVGELTVIDQQPRNATAYAVGLTTCLALASWDLIALLERDPGLALNMLRDAGQLACAKPTHSFATEPCADGHAPRRQEDMNQAEILDALARLALFADLDHPQLQAVAHTMSEESFPAGQRILRQGFSGTGFFVILDGEVGVRVDGRMWRGWAGASSSARSLCCWASRRWPTSWQPSPVTALQLAGPDLRAFLLAYPPVMYRMLQSVSRRLERANRRG